MSAVFITFKVDGRSIARCFLNVLGEEALALFGFGFIQCLLFGGGYGRGRASTQLLTELILNSGAVRELTVSNSEQP